MEDVKYYLRDIALTSSYLAPGQKMKSVEAMTAPIMAAMCRSRSMSQHTIQVMCAQTLYYLSLYRQLFAALQDRLEAPAWTMPDPEWMQEEETFTSEYNRRRAQLSSLFQPTVTYRSDYLLKLRFQVQHGDFEVAKKFMERSMTIGVIGGGGSVGQALLQTLLQNGHSPNSIVVSTRQPEKLAEFINQGVQVFFDTHRVHIIRS